MTTVTTNYIRNAQRHASFPSVAAAAAIYDTQRLVRLNPDIWRPRHPENFDLPWIPEVLPLLDTSGSGAMGSGNFLQGLPGSADQLAQSFSLSLGATVTRLDVAIGLISAPTDGIQVDLLDSLTSGASSLATASIDPISAYLDPSGTGRMAFYLSPTVHIGGNRTYYLRLRRTGVRDTTNRYSWFRSDAAYADGQAYTSSNDSYTAQPTFDFQMWVYGSLIDYAIPPFDPRRMRANSLLRR